MNPRYLESTLTQDVRQTLTALAEEGAAEIGSSQVDNEPSEIVRAIGDYVERRRKQPGIIDDWDLICRLACLWANQVCRAHDWEWTALYEGADQSGSVHTEDNPLYTIVSPNRHYQSNPFQFIEKFFADPDRDNTVILAFNMIGSKYLPPSDENGYLNLG